MSAQPPAATSNTPSYPPVAIAPTEPTQAELKLQEDANKAKNKLYDEIKNIKVDDGIASKEIDSDQFEDPRV